MRGCPAAAAYVDRRVPRPEQDRRARTTTSRLASNYGNQIQRWNGVDLTVNVRPRGGVLLQGGLSTGRTLTDNCEILAQLPEISPLGAAVLPSGDRFLTQLKFFGSYTVPKVDVQVSGAFQSIPGPQLAANQVRCRTRRSSRRSAAI